MFVGHAALAFALVAGAAAFIGVDERRALLLGGVAGAFATVPDVDILYAGVGLVRLPSPGVWSAADAFWATGNVVHRAVTHSLVVGVPLAVGTALVTDRRGRLPAAGIGLGLVAWVWTAGGPLAAATAAVAVATAVAVALVAARNYDLEPRAVLATAAVGLLSHPFGDLFTGEPPALLYPLDASVLAGRVTLHPDPTLHLVGAFALELGTLWLAVAIYARLRHDRLRLLVDRRASIGVGYAAAAFVIPAPTLEVSYHFVFSVLAVGVVTVVLARRRGVPTREPRLAAVVSGLAAVSVALAAYTVAYAAL